MADAPGERVFEITDYTTASDWERFIAGLEEVLTEWDLNKQTNRNCLYRDLPPGFITSGIWHQRTDTLKFGNSLFDIQYLFIEEKDLTPNIKQDGRGQKSSSDLDDKSNLSEEHEYQDAEDSGSVESFETDTNLEHGQSEHELHKDLPECIRDFSSTSNDFASKAHCLVRWYNLRKFIILSLKGDTIVSEDRMKLILSSASIALTNTDCHVPLFVQIRNPKNNFYQGISEHLNIRTLYEMVFFKGKMNNYSYLSELISMFREKTGCCLNDPISITIRINYCLDTFELFGSENYSDALQDDQGEHSKSLNIESKAVLACPISRDATYEEVIEALEGFQSTTGSLKFLHVAALWPPVSDKVITDSQVHSDLDSAEAPIWTVRCVMKRSNVLTETKALFDLFNSALDYAYDNMDANLVFDDCDRESLKSRCLKLSYDLVKMPEVILSERQSDSMRKLIALLFHRAEEISTDLDAFDQLAAQLKKNQSLEEVYRKFSKKCKPSVKEFIIRTQIPRPFNSQSMSALPQRIFCTLCDEEFRLCGAFTELTN